MKLCLEGRARKVFSKINYQNRFNYLSLFENVTSRFLNDSYNQSNYASLPWSFSSTRFLFRVCLSSFLRIMLILKKCGVLTVFHLIFQKVFMTMLSASQFPQSSTSSSFQARKF